MEMAAPVRVARAVWVSAAILTSRVLGLVRDQLFAALVGANRFSDAFLVAFRLPNLLRDLFAEGALSSAFVPAFAEADRNRGAQAAHRLASAVLAFVLVAVGAVVVVGELFAGPFVRAIAPGLVEHDLAARLTREMMPFLLLVSLSAVAMGMLNARSRFTTPALAPALFNVGAILTGLVLFVLGYPPERAVLGWAAGTLLGGVLQLSVQMPALHAMGFRFRPRRRDLADKGVRRMFGLMGAAVLGLSATQVNIVVNTIFASREVGATTWLQCAFRLMQLPLGVFGVAIATVAGAGVAQRAAAKDMQSLKETLCSALRLLAFLTVPSAVGLAVLSRPIIGLVYQHGRFAAQDTLKTADALVFYAIGLYAYSGVKVLAPAFYALGEARVAVLGSWASMACNVLANLLLFPRMGYRGVALGTSVAALVNFGFLLVAWRRAHGGLAGRGLFGQLWRVLLASACLAAAANSTHRWLGALDPVAFLRLPPILVVFASILAGGLAYLVAARALAIGELSELWASLGRRRG